MLFQSNDSLLLLHSPASTWSHTKARSTSSCTQARRSIAMVKRRSAKIFEAHLGYGIGNAFKVLLQLQQKQRGSGHQGTRGREKIRYNHFWQENINWFYLHASEAEPVQTCNRTLDEDDLTSCVLLEIKSSVPSSHRSWCMTSSSSSMLDTFAVIIST